MSEMDEIGKEAQYDIKESTDALRNSLRVQYKNGKASFYGISVPKALGPGLDWVSDTFAKDIIGSIGDLAEKGASLIAEKIAPTKAGQTSKAAKWVATLALLTGQPLGKLYHAFKEKWQIQAELYKEFKPVIETTGAKVATNEIMAVEFGHVHDSFMSKVRLLIPELPTLIIKSLFVIEDLQVTELANPILQSHATEENFKKNKVKLLKNIKEQITSERVGTHHPVVEKFLANDDKIIMGGVSAFKQGLEYYVADESKKHAVDHHPTAWRMIQGLRERLEEIAGPNREDGVCGFTNIDSHHLGSIKNQVKDVIQQHEIDMKRGEITGTGNLKALNDVSQLIAEALADGTIDAYALVNLVGDGKVIGRGQSGKKAIDIAAAESQIASLRDKLGACVAPDPQEFYAHFDSPEVMKEALKKHLHEMHSVEKVCFASLFSDGVLKAAGMAQEEIVAARKQAHRHMYNLVAANVKELAEKSKDELAKLQIKEEDIDALLQMADQIEMGDKQALKNLVDGRGRVLLQNILGVAALQELQADKNAWAERMKPRRRESDRAQDSRAEEADAYRKAHDGMAPDGEDMAEENGWGGREQHRRKHHHESSLETADDEDDAGERVPRRNDHASSPLHRTREHHRRHGVAKNDPPEVTL